MSKLLASADIREILDDHGIVADDLCLESACRLASLMRSSLENMAFLEGVAPDDLKMGSCAFSVGDSGILRKAILAFSSTEFVVDARLVIEPNLTVAVDATLMLAPRFCIVKAVFKTWCEELRRVGDDLRRAQMASKWRGRAA